MRQIRISQSITNRDESNSLEYYFAEVNKLDMISADEEIELAIKIQNGDNVAFKKLINANLRFVISVAKQYQNQGLSLADLINEGNLGLIKAAGKFDHSKGFKFISYAVWWIRQSIIQALAETSRVVRLPTNQITKINKVLKESTRQEQILGRLVAPTDLEIENMELCEINQVISMNAKPVRLDAFVADDENNRIINLIPDEDTPSPDNNFHINAIKNQIELALDKLTPREKDVIKMIFGIGQNETTYGEISLKFGCCSETIRKIHHTALRKMKRNSGKMLVELL